MDNITITRRDFIKTCGTVAGATIIGLNFAFIPCAYASETSYKSHMNERINGVYAADGKFGIRASQDNLQVQALYENWLGDVGGHKAHELLHMRFRDKSENVKRLGIQAVNPRASEFESLTYPYEE